MPDYKPARLRRLAAFAVDSALMPLVMFVTIAVCSLLPENAFALAIGVAVFLCLSAVYCRDYLLSGRSIGKRLFGLSVVDSATGLPATGKQLILKGLCFMIAPLDAMRLVLTGRSAGERISGTAVVRGNVSGPIEAKRFLKVAAVAAAVGLLLGCVISFALNAAKDNESYAISLDYLTEHAEFEGDASLTGFSATIHGTEQSHSYTFSTSSGYYTVTCHPDPEGVWAVCGECTELN